MEVLSVDIVELFWIECFQTFKGCTLNQLGDEMWVLETKDVKVCKKRNLVSAA